MNFEGHYKIDLSPVLSVVSMVSSAVAAPVAMTQPRQEAVAVAIAIGPVSPAMVSSIAAMITPIAAMAPIAAIVVMAIGVMAIRMVTIPRMASVQVMDIIASTEEWPKLGFSQYLN